MRKKRKFPCGVCGSWYWKDIRGRVCEDCAFRPKKPKTNPPTEIYERVNSIIATKGPGHKCDAACKRARHTYRHTFKGKHPLLGLENGDLLIPK